MEATTSDGRKPFAFDFVGVYLAVAVVYLVMVFALDALLKLLERKTKIPGIDIETQQ
ncbi:MAG: hypothetical protein GX825_01085 [Syntrophomonadaceae bacterium]|nr:hypothetical protein [Syntrophomonadaceae bacterium]